LDRSGLIVGVNAAWESFCVANGGDLASCGVGVSYLAVCEASADPVARQVADAIRAAIDGDLPAPIVVRIPCDAPGVERFFDVLISCRHDGGVHVGATVTLSAAPAPVAAAPQASIAELLAVVDELHDDIIQQLFAVSLALQVLEGHVEHSVSEAHIGPRLEALDALIRRIRARALESRPPS
jgi:hypothetical protein